MTLALVMKFMSNIWVRRAALALVLLLAFVYYKEHYISQGKKQGHEEAGQDVKQETKQQVDEARAQYISQLQGLTATNQQLKHDAEIAQARADAALAVAAKIGTQRADAATGVSKVDDSHMHGYVVTSLGLRAPGDLTACYTPAEEREIANRVVDDPLCKQQAAKNAEGIAGQAEDIKKLKDGQAGMQKQFDLLAAYTGKVEGAYVVIYNAFPKKTNRLLWIVTLGHKGKEKKPPFPDPQELISQKKTEVKP